MARQRCGRKGEKARAHAQSKAETPLVAVGEECWMSGAWSRPFNSSGTMGYAASLTRHLYWIRVHSRRVAGFLLAALTFCCTRPL